MEWTIGRVKDRYLKYKNAGNELVSQTLTDIPPTSCEFGISPVYFCSQESIERDIEDFACFVYPNKHSKLISLGRIILSTFIYHKKMDTESNTRRMYS